jgi:dolichyl-phosphate beta-glucosyltransferase
VIASVVIPAFRERARLPALLDDLVAAVAGGRSCPTEFVVVDDGSPPEHAVAERAAVEQAAARLIQAGAPHRIRWEPLPRNQGKGAAIRHGWALADPGARWLGFLDADGAVGASEAWRLLDLAAADPPVDLLAGTRIRMAGRTIARGLHRHLQGRVFATLSERLFRTGFYDTQCGFKLLRADLLRPLLPSLREDRWLLDLELVALMRWRGARCVEEPIDWCDPGGSKVIPGLDALRMAVGMWRLRRRLLRSGWRAPPPPGPTPTR